MLSPSKKDAKSPQSSSHLGALHVSLLQTVQAPVGPSPSSPKSGPGLRALMHREAEHCAGAAVPQGSPSRGHPCAPQNTAEWDPAGWAPCECSALPN